MAKKSLSGDRTVKKKVLKPSTEKVEGNSKSATGQRKAASVSINSLKEQLAQRNDELAIINSVQEGLASKLEMQDIYDLVGNKLREIFNADATSIFSYDRERQSVYGHYYVERDQPVPPLELPFGQGLYTHIIKSRQPLQFGTQQEWLKAGASIVNSPGQDRELNELYLGVPILLGNEVTGVVAIQSYKLNAFGENDVRLLTTLANSMSVALENACLFDETQRLLKITEDRAAELAIINSVQAALAAELNIQGIYDVVGDKIHEIFHNTDMDIRIYDPTTNLLHFPYVYENGKRVTVASIPFQGGGFGQYVLRTRETLVINENVLQEMEKYGSYVLPGTQQLEKSVLFVPLVIGAQARGLITLANTEREHAFSESDVRLLQTLANSMSIALENARLFKAEQERVAELAVINSVQEALASKLDLKAIYDLVGDKIRKPFDADHAYILTFNREQGLIYFEYSIEGEQKDWGWDMPLSEIMLRYFDEGKQPLVINRDMWRESSKYGLYHIKDMLTVFDERGKLREVYEGEPPILYDKDFDIKSVLWAPLIVGNRVGGVVGLENQVHEDAFTELDVRLFQTLTNAVSVAMENARLFDETQRLFKAEQERVAELQIINSIQQGLAAELDFQSIVDLVGDKLCEVFMTNDFAMRWYDEKTNLVHFLYEYEHGERLDIPPGPPTPGGSFEQFLRDRQPIIGNTLDIMARTGGISVPGTDTSKSVVSVPIITSDRVIGSLQIENYERENVYGESELRLLTTIAASLGTALENARLFDEVQKRNLEISEALKQQTATSDVLRAMSSFQPDLRSLLEIIADNIAKVCDANDAHIYRLEGQALKEWTYRGPIPGLEAGESLPLNRGSVIGRAILDRQIIHIHDAQVELNETEYPVSVSLQRRWGYRTVLATPLLRDGEPIGGIAIRRVRGTAVY